MHYRLEYDKQNCKRIFAMYLQAENANMNEEPSLAGIASTLWKGT